MKLAAVSVLALLLASTAVAQLTPGLVVRAGEPFPFIADFNGDGLDDLIQEHNPAAVTSIMRLPARGRAFRTTSPETALQIQIQGECIDASSERWTFVRDGIFGVAQHGQTKIETVFEGQSTIDFRVTAPYTVEPSVGVLTESSKGTFSGSAWVRTSCGWKTMNVMATVQ